MDDNLEIGDIAVILKDNYTKIAVSDNILGTRLEVTHLSSDGSLVGLSLPLSSSKVSGLEKRPVYWCPKEHVVTNKEFRKMSDDLENLINRLSEKIEEIDKLDSLLVGPGASYIYMQLSDKAKSILYKWESARDWGDDDDDT